jgi:hypothetical protein
MSVKTIDPKLHGLSEAEARHRLITHGPNTLPEAKSISHWQRWYMPRIGRPPHMVLMCGARMRRRT